MPGGVLLTAFDNLTVFVAMPSIPIEVLGEHPPTPSPYLRATCVLRSTQHDALASLPRAKNQLFYIGRSPLKLPSTDPGPSAGQRWNA